MKPHPHSRLRRTRAFTLIELLVVILILAILSALVVPKFLSKTDDAKVARSQTDLSELSKMLDVFRLDCGRYPTTEEGLDALYTRPSGVEGWKQYTGKPIPMDAWGKPYVYTYPGNSEDSYYLASYGADGVPGGESYNEDIVESQ